MQKGRLWSTIFSECSTCESQTRPPICTVLLIAISVGRTSTDPVWVSAASSVGSELKHSVLIPHPRFVSPFFRMTVISISTRYCRSKRYYQRRKAASTPNTRNQSSTARCNFRCRPPFSCIHFNLLLCLVVLCCLLWFELRSGQCPVCCSLKRHVYLG